jgi:UDP-2-acetamido-3-amino-2,3-dideoxy-glucuronate N-acetyltransferase
VETVRDAGGFDLECCCGEEHRAKGVNELTTTPEQNSSAPFIHPTAVVERGAKVGRYTKVWFFAHVAPGAVIGENCSLGQNTYVEWNAIVGNACRLGNSVSIYSHVELEDFVFCAPYMVFTHISFPRAAVNRHAVFRKTLVKTGTTLGANSTVVPGVTCGVGTFVAAGSTLTKSSKDWSMMVGTPARQVGWVSAFGEKIGLPLLGEGEWRCSHTGDVYVLNGSEMTRHPGPRDILKYESGAPLQRMEVK